MARKHRVFVSFGGWSHEGRVPLGVHASAQEAARRCDTTPDLDGDLFDFHEIQEWKVGGKRKTPVRTWTRHHFERFSSSWFIAKTTLAQHHPTPPTGR